MTSKDILELAMGISIGGAIIAGVLNALHSRLIQRHTVEAWSGCIVTEGAVGVYKISGLSLRQKMMVFFWWPGKRRWEEHVVTQAVLCGAEFIYNRMTSYNFDEGWSVAIGIDPEQTLPTPWNRRHIVSTKKVTVALAYLQWRLQDEAQPK